MIIIVWSFTGFHVFDILSKDSKFNAHHYVSAILQSLADWHIGEVGATDRKLILHADNARPHTAEVSLAFTEQNGMKRALHPPDSQDPVLLDFFLFGHVKEILSGRSFSSADDLLSEIQIILASREKAILFKIFTE
jgi:hypothetical protein